MRLRPKPAVPVALVTVLVIAAIWSPRPAQAHGGCERVVILTLPGVTWEQVDRFRPPNLLAVAEQGAIGSMSVRTNAPRTTYASGFASIGAGARVDGGHSTGGSTTLPKKDALFSTAEASGMEEMRRLLDEAGYATVDPGGMAEALDPNPVAAIGNSDAGFDPPLPEGRNQWALLAATDASGHVDLAATWPTLLEAADAPFGVRTDPDAIATAVERAISIPCSTLVIDPGDLTRADAAAVIEGRYSAAEQKTALMAADDLLGHVDRLLNRHDLLMVVSPTSPTWDEHVHFGVAIATGPDFPPGSFLESPSTRRPGLVTLPDIASTVLMHQGFPRPPSMLGRPMFARSTSETDRIAAALRLDRESVFIDAHRPPITTVFVLLQVLLYGIVGFVLSRRRRRGSDIDFNDKEKRYLSAGALAIASFPISTFLAGFFYQSALGSIGYGLLLILLDVALVMVVSIAVANPLDRLLAITAFTCGVIAVDLLLGANLQFNTLFSYSPLVAGRFSGLGNTLYAVLAGATVIAGTIMVHRGQGSQRVLALTATFFGLVVLVDGAPTFGSDVGGVLALIPGLGITWFLLAERRPDMKTVLWLILGVVVALGVFLAVDLAQPEASRTHLARLFEDVRARGGQVFVESLQRKIQTNIRVFRTSIWTYLVPPALAMIAILLLRPRNRWERVAERYPRLRAGLIGGLILAVLGFAVNDSGIAVPAMMLALLVPLALFMHLYLEDEEA